MKENLLKNIQSVPPLPESVQEIERLYRDIDSTFQDFQMAIEKDPFIAANILRVANTPFYGMKTKVNSLEKAIAMLGKSTIRTFVFSSAIDANFEIDLSPYGVTQEEFRDACEKQMALTLLWLQKSDANAASILAPCAFLGDIGRVLIAKFLIEEQSELLLEEALKSGLSLSGTEERACGSDATKVSAALFENWELDPLMVSLIAHCQDPKSAPKEHQKMAAQLQVIRESVLVDARVSEESLKSAKALIEEFGLDLESFEQAIEKLETPQENL